MTSHGMTGHLSPAQQARQHHRDTHTGRYTHPPASAGLPDTSSFPDPWATPTPDTHTTDTHTTDTSSTDWRTYHLPDSDHGWDNLPEYQLATSETFHDIAHHDGPHAATDYLHEQWQREHQRFTDARHAGDYPSAALHAENLRHLHTLTHNI